MFKKNSLRLFLQSEYIMESLFEKFLEQCEFLILMKGVAVIVELFQIYETSIQ